MMVTPTEAHREDLLAKTKTTLTTSQPRKQLSKRPGLAYLSWSLKLLLWYPVVGLNHPGMMQTGRCLGLTQ